jgi:hypothetical protein
MSILERPEFDQAVAELSAPAEPAILESAWARGRALEEAVAYALTGGGD